MPNEFTLSVAGLLDQLATQWAAGDSAGYAALCTDDVDYTAFDGSVLRGRGEVEEGHRALFAGIMRGSRMVFEPAHVRKVADEVAVVTVRGGVIMRWQGASTTPSRKRVSSLTFVLVRRDDRCLVSAFQNTRYRPWDKTLLGRLVSRSANR